MLESAEGIEHVLDMLGRIDYGVYSWDSRILNYGVLLPDNVLRVLLVAKVQLCTVGDGIPKERD